MTTPSSDRDTTTATGSRPDFLRLPERTTKPRRLGVTHVLDNGMPLAEVEQRLTTNADSIDIWKFGWGTAYVDPALDAKLALLREHTVLACTGGTLLEVAWRDGAARQLMEWARRVGFPCMEVSCGTIAIPREAKSQLIRSTADHFTVLAEVGAKDPRSPVTPAGWAEDAAADRDAGAAWVVTEGRESGTVGLFDPSGEVRAEVAQAVVDAVGLETVLFEAPRRAQQGWLIRRYGANTNLGNISPAEVLAVETLRLGLRSDTMPQWPSTEGDLAGGPGGAG
ncbi:MAG: phosphosulfolactate synthase [Marmoricola sp.]